MNFKNKINLSTTKSQKENLNQDICFLNKIDVKQIIADLVSCEYADEIFYVCNLDEIIRRYQLWYEKMPSIMPYYAVKCNDHDIVLKLLASLGVGFDCASTNEILKIKNLNVPSERIVFANPAKFVSQIQIARRHDVGLMVFDCESELMKIKKYYPNAKLLLRFRCEAKTSFRKMGDKFGCDLKADSRRLIKLVKQEDMDLVGVTFHVGSGCTETLAFRRAIESSRELFDIAKEVGFNCTLLDIGGGVPGDEPSDDLFSELAHVINDALKYYFSDIDGITVISEPGRFFLTTAFHLVSCIHTKKVRDTAIGCPREFMYMICDGVYGAFDKMMYSHEKSPVQALKQVRKANLYKTSLWGPTCDGNDQIPNEVLLPELEIGDWVYFENMGAYSMSVSCSFNGFGGVPIKFYQSDDMAMMIQEQQISEEQINSNESDSFSY